MTESDECCCYAHSELPIFWQAFYSDEKQTFGERERVKKLAWCKVKWRKGCVRGRAQLVIRVTLGLGPPHSRGVAGFVDFTPPGDSADRQGAIVQKKGSDLLFQN